MYSTELKSKILEIIKKSDKPVSVVSLISELSDYNKTSIYRSIKSLVSAGRVNEISGGRSQYYEMAEAVHSHFICNLCSGVTCIKGKVAKFVLPNSFEIDSVNIRGRCAGCV